MPQQNGVVDMKNRTLEEIVHVMHNAKGVRKKFWAKVMNTACYIINRVYLKLDINMTPNVIWKGRNPNLKYFHILGP